LRDRPEACERPTAETVNQRETAARFVTSRSWNMALRGGLILPVTIAIVDQRGCGLAVNGAIEGVVKIPIDGWIIIPYSVYYSIDTVERQPTSPFSDLAVCLPASRCRSLTQSEGKMTAAATAARDFCFDRAHTNHRQ
jgi:hypothetical protein